MHLTLAEVRARELPQETKIVAGKSAQVIDAGLDHDQPLDTETKGKPWTSSGS